MQTLKTQSMELKNKRMKLFPSIITKRFKRFLVKSTGAGRFVAKFKTTKAFNNNFKKCLDKEVMVDSNKAYNLVNK